MKSRGAYAWSAALALLCALAWTSASETTSSPSIARLVAPETLRGRVVAAISIDDPARGHSWFYAQSKDVWRSREAHGAPADRERVQELLVSILESHGRELSIAPERLAAYGLDEKSALRVRLHGKQALKAADGDVFVDIDIGASVGGLSFARDRSNGRVVELDRDPGALIAARGDLPPLIDTRLLAGTIGAGFQGFRRFFVDVEGGDSFELAGEFDPDGVTETRWTLVAGDARASAITWRVGGYTNFLVREEWRGLASAKQAVALGLTPPRAKITLQPSSGPVLELWVSKPDASKRFYVWNKLTNVVLVLDADLEDYLVPKRSWFTDTTIQNPWERWIAR